MENQPLSPFCSQEANKIIRNWLPTTLVECVKTPSLRRTCGIELEALQPPRKNNSLTEPTVTDNSYHRPCQWNSLGVLGVPVLAFVLVVSKWLFQNTWNHSKTIHL
jgi:hypothetical protein